MPKRVAEIGREFGPPMRRVGQPTRLVGGPIRRLSVPHVHGVCGTAHGTHVGCPWAIVPSTGRAKRLMSCPTCRKRPIVRRPTRPMDRP